MIYTRERSDVRNEISFFRGTIRASPSYLSGSTKDRKDNEAGRRGEKADSKDECKVERNAAEVER